jgi:hypothetical protein
VLQDGDGVKVVVIKSSINLALYKGPVFSLACPSLNIKQLYQIPYEMFVFDAFIQFRMVPDVEKVITLP